jgi:hypothetical protein
MFSSRKILVAESEESTGTSTQNVEQKKVCQIAAGSHVSLAVATASPRQLRPVSRKMSKISGFERWGESLRKVGCTSHAFAAGAEGPGGPSR